MSLDSETNTEGSGKRTPGVPVSRRLRSAGRSAIDFLRRTARTGKQRFTIMFIPHSEKRVLNLQLNTFALVFAGALVVAVVGGFFVLATVFAGSERIAEQTGARLQDAEASLDEIRQEVGAFLLAYDEFEGTLSSTLQRLEIETGSDGDTLRGSGDLASMLDLEEVNDGDLREIKDLQRVVASLRSSIGPLNEISEVLDLSKQLLSDIPNRWPVVGQRGWVTMEWGPNMHPIQGIWYMHKGIDISHTQGTPIVAAANGEVEKTGFDTSGYGGYIEINHNYGFRTKYGHLIQSFEVSEGDSVVQGQIIGRMGNTGLSTGTHLDFQIWIGTENIDPAHFLRLSKPNFNRVEPNRL